MGKTGLIQLVAGFSSKTGAPVYEELLVEDLGNERYRVVRSPGFVLGVAAGDEVELDQSTDPGFRVLKRGGNVNIQFFQRGGLEEPRGFLEGQLSPLGGWLDGIEKGTLVFSVPVSAGFPAIEGVMSEAMKRFPDAEWGFGNVYDPKDGVTPLNWWKKE